MIQTNCDWRNMKSISPIIWMTPSKVHFHDSPLRSFVDGYLLPRRGHPKHDLAIHHLPHLWLRRNFSENIGNIFLYYLVALSSCNTRFREEKWELSQLGDSGEMQLLQKDFDMAKNICGCWLGKQNIHRIQENIPVINVDPGVPFLRILNHKTYLSYI